MTMPSVDQSIERLRDFRAQFADDAIVEASSGLTARDLDAVIQQAAGTIGEIPIEDLDAAALEPFAPHE